MAKKSSASSRREKLKKVSGKNIYKVTPKMQKELGRVAALTEDDINLSDPDAPKLSDWSKAVRGKFYRPLKKAINIRLDRDVLAWFKHTDKKYQTLINQVCREYMQKHGKFHRLHK